MKIIFNILIFMVGFNKLYAFEVDQKNILDDDKKEITIRVFYPGTTTSDSLILFQTNSNNILVDEQHFNSMNWIKAARSKMGSYLFTIRPDKNTEGKFSYISIYQLKRINDRNNYNSSTNFTDIGYEIIPFYLFRGGENITVRVNTQNKLDIGRGYRHNFSLRFVGKGAQMQTLRYKADSIAYNVLTDNLLNQNLSYNNNNYKNRTINSSLKLLEINKNKLYPDEYLQLKAYVIFSNKRDEGLLLQHIYKKNFSNFNSIQRSSFLNSYDSVYNSYLHPIPRSVYVLNKEFAEAELKKVIIHSYVNNGPQTLDSLYVNIKKENVGIALDRVLVEYFKNNYAKQSLIAQLNDAVATAKDVPSKEYFQLLASKLPGRLAFNFSLQNSLGEVVKLSDFKGKVIVIDFWYTGCVNCINYYNDCLSKVENKFAEDKDIVFISISIDKSKKLWQRSLLSEKYSSKNGINLITNDNGSLIKYYDVHSFPQPVLIDRNLKIARFDYDLRSKEALISEILKLK